LKLLVPKEREVAAPEARKKKKDSVAPRQTGGGRAGRSGRICPCFVSKSNMIKPKYFLYARKSTEDDDRQVMSIEAQLFELREYARKENLEILEEFQESKSAKTPGREIFGKLMEKVERGDGVGILAWHPDRLARNSMDGGRVVYAVDQKKIVSLRFPTFWFEPTPQGLFMLQVAFGQSKYYSDNLAENIKRGIRQKLRRGEWLNLAPFGYVNDPLKRNIAPHPTEARIVQLAFEEYAKGTHTLVSLGAFLAELGVVSRNGTPLAKASIKRLITNRAYLGFVKHGKEWFDGNFEPLISPALFEAVQKVLLARERPRKRKVKHDFPFTGLFRCGECNSMISAQWTTNRHGTKYRYYRCSKKRGRCSQSYIQEKTLAKQLRARLQTVSLCDRYTDWMLAKVKEWEREEVSASHSETQNLSATIKASEARLEKLVSMYLDGDVSKEIYLKKKDESMRAALALREKLKDLESGRNQWVEPLREWILDTKQAAFLSEHEDLNQTKRLVQKIGTNPIVRDKSARFSLPAPFRFVAERRHLFSSSAPLARPPLALSEQEVSMCGEGGIRTLGAVSDTQSFQDCRLNRSRTSPFQETKNRKH
jgi:site-specific DNA recombinase